MFITSGRGTQSKDGTLLHCLVNLDKGTHVFGSKDHGDSWFLIDYPLKPGDESKIIELSNGDWLVNSRVNSNKFRYSHLTKDKGKSSKRPLIRPSNEQRPLDSVLFVVSP